MWFMDKPYLEKLDLRAYAVAAITKRLGMPEEVVARFVDPARRYTVKTNEDYGWAAGKAYNGRTLRRRSTRQHDRSVPDRS